MERYKVAQGVDSREDGVSLQGEAGAKGPEVRGTDSIQGPQCPEGTKTLTGA